MDLLFAREQMALSLGWHIVIACFGIVLPAMTAFAEWRGQHGDADMARLAHTWARAMGVLFAVGAVSGTVLSFEMGVLWPGLMSRFGEIYGYPFTLEGFAFFLEAIFVGIYLFGWDRLPPRVHLLCALPIVLSGIAGGFFVVAANAWMNTPTGFELAGGQVIRAEPVAAMFNPSTAAEVVHMLIGAVLVVGFSVASVYAVGMLRGRRDRYHRLGLLLPLTAAVLAAPVQIVAGDWIAGVVAEHQPVKLAALEAHYETSAGVPLSLGGIYYDDRLHYAVSVPRGLSLLVHHRPGAEVIGLDSVPPDQRPPVNITHLSYDVMVGLGFALAALAAWTGWSWWRRRDIPRGRWFLRAVSVSGLAAVAALEGGWIATEVGRQPWIVYRVQLTRDAVSTAPGLRYGFFAVLLVYLVLTALTAYVLRRLARAPQEIPS